MNVPITEAEVQTSVKKLNNRRAPGKDEIYAELIKYGPETLIKIIGKVLNLIFEKHQEIDVGVGLIASITKPKFKGEPKDLRPVTLLTIIRKILSNIVQKRISSKVNNYLSASQHAYREGKSTSDIIWCFRWLAAKMQIVKGRIYVTGIDMSSAFDTIKRSNLLEILRKFLDEDEMRIIRILLSNTTLELKMKDTETKMFKSNMGSPQGDGLSGLLFDVYFENSLRKVRFKMISNSALIEHSYIKIKTEIIPEESTYADDADFMTTEESTKNKLNNIVKDTLLEDNLVVNDTKTEHTIIERGKKRNEEEWRNVKKLGSLLGDGEDIIRRKQLAIVANKEFNQLWIRKEKLSLRVRLRIYNSLVKPILLYNCGTWGISKKEEDSLNAFHRRQLRYVLKINHPHHISNANVYKICKEEPISLFVLKSRWRLFGHELRGGEDAPAYKAMLFYFARVESTKFRGRPRFTLPVRLNSDLKYTNENDCEFLNRYGVKELKSINDLELLYVLAADRKLWKDFTNKIFVTAKANIAF